MNKLPSFFQISKCLSILFFIAFSVQLQAQKHSVSGKIFASNNTPIGLASVALSDTSGLVVDGIFSDDNGKFDLKAIAGEYVLSISFIGFESYKDTIDLNEDLSFSEIILNSESEVLGEVLVSDFRNEMTAGVDKRVVHISEELRRSNSNLSELLELIPLVNMDFDGKPSIPGKRSVIVLVDGRPPKIRANDLATVLRSIPTDQIKSIEIMTNPPAKYTRSNAAVINVVTDKFEMDGYVVNLRANTNSELSPGYGGGFTYKKAKFSLNSWGGRWFWDSESTETSLTTNSLSDIRNQIRRNVNSTYNSNGAFYGIAPEYEIDKKNTISVNVGGWFWDGKSNNTNDLEILNRNSEVQEMYSTSSNGRNKGGSIYTGIEYFRSFDQKERELTADLEMSFPFNDNSNYQEAIYSGETSVQETITDVSGVDFGGSIDYFHPLDSTSSLNFELEFENSFPQDESYITRLGDENSVSIFDPLSFENIKEEFYQAFTVTYSKKFKSYNLSLDLGQEYTKFNNKYENGKKYDKSFLFLTPAVRISKKIAKAGEIGLSYKFGQDAPYGWVTSQNERISVDGLVRSIGNLDLEAERNHDVELSHSIYLGKFNLGTVAFVRVNENSIEGYTTVLSDGTYFRTYRNSGQLVNSGLQMSLSGDIKKKVRINLNGSIFDSRLNVDAEAERRTTSFNLSGNFTWILPAETRIILRGNYQGPSLELQGERSGKYSLSTSIRKSFLKKRLGVTLSFRDILESNKSEFLLVGDNYREERNTFRRFPWFSLRVNYKIGELKERPKSSKASEQSR